MKQLTIIILVVMLISLVGAQGYFPPGVQYNPFFNSQNPFPNPFTPAKNFTFYNPFSTFIRPQVQNNTNGFGFGNFWNRNPYFANYFNSTNQFRPRALVGNFPYYQSQYNIPEFHQCNGSHSLALGFLTPWDRVLVRQSYVKPGRWYSRREKYVYYPGDLPVGLTRNETITAIRIQDRHCNGTGGYAQILPNGGVGYRNVTIRLYSDGAGKGFNFYIQIFGR